MTDNTPRNSKGQRLATKDDVYGAALIIVNAICAGVLVFSLWGFLS